jgi:hypothetical protein
MSVVHGAIGAGGTCSFTSAVTDAEMSTDDVSVTRTSHVP